jgi:hypothetical protein
MSLSNDLLSLFAKTTNDKSSAKKETTVYGTVVIQNGKQYVKIDGSELLTPVESTTDMQNGERVNVLIKGHTATVIGNISSPSARTDTVKELENNVEKFKVKISDDVNAIEIGIKNILLKSGDVVISTDYYMKYYSLSSVTAPNKDYTIVIKANLPINHYLDGYVGSDRGCSCRFEGTGKDELYYMQFTTPEDREIIYPDRMLFYNNANMSWSNDGSTGTIYWACLYEGHVKPPMNWVAAPEDINANMNEKYSELLQTIDGFRTTVSNTYVTKTDMNNLEIGVNNILLKSGDVVTNSDYRIKTYITSKTIEPNKDYTIVIKANIPTEHILYGYMGQTAKSSFGFNGTGKDELYYIQFTTPSNEITYLDRLIVYNRYKRGSANEDNAIGTIYWACLYEGHVKVPMNWIAAPEDTVNDISNLSTSYSEITNKVSTMEQDMNGFKTTVSSTYVTKTESAHDKLGNLVKNGYGEYLDNSYFSASTKFTRGDCPEGCYGYFRGGEARESIMFNNLKKYDYEYYARLDSTLTVGAAYFGLKPLDVDGNLIKPENVLFTYDKLFYLAQDLKPGDTVVYFTDLTDWGETTETYHRSFIFFGYTDSTGYTYPDGTYSQYSYTDNIYPDDSFVDTTNNIITLTSPWDGPTFVAGTCVGHAARSASFCYYGQTGAISNKEWKKWSGVIQANPEGTWYERRMFYAKSFVVNFYNTDANYAGVCITEQVIDETAREDASAAQNAADLATERIRISESIIEQLSNSISMLVRDGNGGSLMTQTEDGWVFSIGTIENMLSDVSNKLDELTNKTDDTNGAVDVLKESVSELGVLSNYIQITTSGNKPCIELGSTGSDFKVRITNTDIQFIDGPTIPAYLSNQKLNIEQAEVKDELVFGGFVWKSRDNGNMGLTWKGVES